MKCIACIGLPLRDQVPSKRKVIYAPAYDQFMQGAV